MKKSSIIILISSLLVFTSCLFEQKDIFDKTPAERMEAYLNEYQELLESSADGWIMEYYPESYMSYGGYVYFLTFNEGEVSAQFQMATDVSKPITSLYKMTPDDGPVLSFDTYNEYLHYFANPSSSEYQGKGGDTEFKIMGKSEDESEIYLIGRKSGNPCKLVRNDEWNATEYLTACNAIKNELNYSTITSMEFQVGDAKGEAEKGGDMEFNNYLYFGYPEDGVMDSEDEVLIEGEFPFCTTPDGIRLFEPVEIDGAEYDYFYYDGENNRFITEDEYVSINMIYTAISQQFADAEWYIAHSNLSPAAAAIFSEVEATLASSSDAIEYIAFGTGLSGSKKYGLEFQCTKGKGTFEYKPNVKAEDKLGLKYTMVNDGDAKKYLTNLLKIIDCFGRSSEKTFTVETDNFKVPTWIKLTDVNNTAFSVKLVKGKVAYK